MLDGHIDPTFLDICAKVQPAAISISDVIAMYGEATNMPFNIPHILVNSCICLDPTLPFISVTKCNFNLHCYFHTCASINMTSNATYPNYSMCINEGSRLIYMQHMNSLVSTT